MITYTLREFSQVALVIHNVLGQQIQNNAVAALALKSSEITYLNISDNLMDKQGVRFSLWMASLWAMPSA